MSLEGQIKMLTPRCLSTGNFPSMAHRTQERGSKTSIVNQAAVLREIREGNNSLSLILERHTTEIFIWDTNKVCRVLCCFAGNYFYSVESGTGYNKVRHCLGGMPYGIAEDGEVLTLDSAWGFENMNQEFIILF